LKLLIIRPGALGDTLLMLPVLAELKDKATIHFVGRQPGLAHIHDAVHHAMDLERAGWHRLFSDESCLWGPSSLPVQKADRIIAFFKDEKGTIRQNLKIFFPNAPVSVFPSFPPRGEKIHVVRYLAGCLASAGLPVNSHAIMDKIGRRPFICGPRASKHRDRMVLHPGSGDPHKNHPPGFWLDIFKECMNINRFARLKPTLLLGPAEASLRNFFNHHKNLITHMEILFCPEKETLLRVLGSATLYLGHDSGITHLSGLMGTPTVALFKHTDPIQWGPVGMRVRVIHGEKADGELMKRITAVVSTL
jgi:ADP-heptose:LPS heptosyltransferase